MKVDINELLAEISKVIRDTFKKDWPLIKKNTMVLLQNKKERWELLILLREKGELTQDKFESYLEDEKYLLEAEFHAMTVVTKAMAEKTTNAVINVILDTVKTLIPLT